MQARSAARHLIGGHRAILCLLVMGLLLTLAACRTRQPTTEAGLGGIVLRCHYLEGEKYALDQDSTQFDNWMGELTQQMAEGRAQAYDLFSHQGGGPAGAEWNADGAILVIAQLPTRMATITQPQLLLNGRAIRFRMTQETGSATRYCYLVPGKQWTGLLRPITPEDYALLYPDRKNAASGPGSPIGEGQVLRVEFSWPLKGRKKTVVKAFHVAYGE